VLLHVGLALDDRYYARRQMQLAELPVLPLPPPASCASPAVQAASRARADALAALPTERFGELTLPTDGEAAAADAVAGFHPLDALDGDAVGCGGDAAAPVAASPSNRAADSTADRSCSDADGSAAEPLCAFCVAPLEATDEVVVRPCAHVFHSDVACVRSWLAFRDTCPNGREPVPSPVAAPLPRRRHRRPRATATAAAAAAAAAEAAAVTVAHSDAAPAAALPTAAAPTSAALRSRRRPPRPTTGAAAPPAERCGGGGAPATARPRAAAGTGAAAGGRAPPRRAASGLAAAVWLRAIAIAKFHFFGDSDGITVRVPKMRHRGFFFSRPTGLLQRSDNVM